MKKNYTPDGQKKIALHLVFRIMLIAALLPGINVHAQIANLDSILASDQGVVQRDAGGPIVINGPRVEDVQYTVNSHRLLNPIPAPGNEAVPSSDGMIKGMIADEKGEGLIYASIVVLDAKGKHTDRGVKTDLDGKYMLSLAPGIYDIQISYVGYASKIIKGILVSKDKPTCLNLKLEPQFQEPYVCYCCCRCRLKDDEEKPEEKEEVASATLRAYPVPLTASVTVEYNLKNAEDVSISLIDMEGRTVSGMLDQQTLAEGPHRDVFSLPAGLPSGIYFISIKKASGDQTVKVLK